MSKIDEAKDGIIGNANGNRDQIVGNANLNKIEIIDNIDEAKGEIMNNLNLLRDENKEWFQRLENNQKVQVLNQITLLRRQKKANFMLTTLIEKTDQIQNEVINTQIIAEYADYLNTIANVGRYYKRIPTKEFGVLKKGRSVNRFKALAYQEDRNGLYASIDLVFQLLTGQGSSFHGGQSVFLYQPTFCEASYYNFFLQRISQGIMLYETALRMEAEEITKETRADWAKSFALTGKVISIQATY